MVAMPILCLLGIGGSRDEICEILLKGLVLENLHPVMNLMVLVPFIWLLLIVLLMGKPHMIFSIQCIEF